MKKVDFSLFEYNTTYSHWRVAVWQAGQELAAALERARRAQRRQDGPVDRAAVLASTIKVKQEEEDGGELGQGALHDPSLVFSSMSEFVRNVGLMVRKIFTYNFWGLRMHPRDSPTQSQQHKVEGDGITVKKEIKQEDEATNGRGVSAHKAESAPRHVRIKREDEAGKETPSQTQPANEEGVGGDNDGEEDDNIGLTQEAPAAVGLAGTLAMLRQRGMFTAPKKVVAAPARAAPANAIEEKPGDREDDSDKFARGGRGVNRFDAGRYDRGGPSGSSGSGSAAAALILPDYKPSFALQYRDSDGNELNSQQAFRHMSHAFHGMGPGKNKMEKLMKRKEEQDNLRRATTGDTPLNTLSLQKRKMEETGLAHIVLDGKLSSCVAVVFGEYCLPGVLTWFVVCRAQQQQKKPRLK
jgi:U4/U6.U5 tri-snRNP-associated protein 1